MASLAIWTAILIWWAFWMNMAWKQRFRIVLLGVSTMAIVFTAAYLWIDANVQESIEVSGADTGESFVGGIALLFFSFVTLVPAVLALLTLGFSRLFRTDWPEDYP